MVNLVFQMGINISVSLRVSLSILCSLFALQFSIDLLVQNASNSTAYIKYEIYCVWSTYVWFGKIFRSAFVCLIRIFACR